MSRFAAPLLGALLILPGLGAAHAGTPRDTIVVAKQIDQFISLDPAEAFEPGVGEVTGNLYDQLVGYRSATDPTIVGDLAESWSISDDGLSYRFTLKPGVTFASGNPVTAQDAAWSLQRSVRLNKSPAFILTQFGFTPDNAADRIHAADDRTLEIKIDHAVAPTFFLNTLTAGVASIVDAKQVQAHDVGGDLGNAWLKDHSAGTGPMPCSAGCRMSGWCWTPTHAGMQMGPRMAGRRRCIWCSCMCRSRPASACCWRRAMSTMPAT
jgi:peptide/nickel transport system substrate-binding protein